MKNNKTLFAIPARIIDMSKKMAILEHCYEQYDNELLNYCEKHNYCYEEVVEEINQKLESELLEETAKNFG